MIGVSARPCSSSAARIAPTRPSIMSLGATTSAPAAAWETAVRASSSSVASLSTTPSARSTPQWPWLVYSHRHTSVITSRSGCAALIARVASWTTPSSSQAPEPCASLAAGRPNSSTAGMPSAAASPASSTAWSIERWSMPGMVGIGVRLSLPCDDEHRVDEVPRRQLGLAHEAAQPAGGTEATQAGGGEGHARDGRRAQAKRRSAMRASAPNASVSAARCSSGVSSAPPLTAASSACSGGLERERARDRRG